MYADTSKKIESFYINYFNLYLWDVLFLCQSFYGIHVTYFLLFVLFYTCVYQSMPHMCMPVEAIMGSDTLDLELEAAGSLWHECWDLNMDPPQKLSALNHSLVLSHTLANL